MSAHRLPGRGLALAAAALLGACAAPQSYVVLLDDEGRTGKVVLTREGSAGLALDTANAAARLDRAEPAGVRLNKYLFETDFDAALAARPLPPRTFRVYFEAGGSTLTAASRTLFPAIAETLARRAAPDVSIVGHTDTVGDAERNQVLALERARIVQQALAELLKDAVAVEVTSHGERNPVVPTADEVDEPRNRRVDITIR